ncbi:hypothetical protein BS78_01G270100 [Paspalum vaginatum]|nr:hypothetical protein BS78_01G270100 [Paspalum vaginatum]
MAGWVNSTGTGSSSGGGGGRGSGGRGFPNRRYTNNSSDMIHGGTTSGGGGRWRGDRSRWRPPPQPHYCYRPVNAAHRHSPPASLSEQQVASSTSTRHAADKSPASGTVAPSSTREPDDKANRNAANFECNVCFDMAAEPVVTKCGHLFCWQCLYQWLHVHSHHRECPICKGQVADDAIIPIYGRGGSAASVDNAPPRPTGARVESSRQQQQQLPTFPHPITYVDDDEEEDPFELAGMMNFGLEAASIREAFMSFMPPSFTEMELEDQYGDFSLEYDTDGYDEAHADTMNIRNNIVSAASSGYHQQEFGYLPNSGANPHNRGRRGRRSRARALANHSSTDGMVTEGSGAFYHDISGSSNASAGTSSRPNGGWAERRGTSNRNPNSARGRGGMQDSRRQRTNYN